MHDNLKSVETKEFPFPRIMRLSGKLAFAGVYDAGAADARGPLKVFSKPTDTKCSRLGLAVSRRVGTAPTRNRIKRLLRESFRLLQHDWPAAYDVVVVVRPHKPLPLEEYQKLLAGFQTRIHKRWDMRGTGR